jgi:precorrin-6x reductase
VTKDSGVEGNTDEKVQAAKDCGIALLVINRPQLVAQNICYSSKELIEVL